MQSELEMNTESTQSPLPNDLNPNPSWDQIEEIFKQISTIENTVYQIYLLEEMGRTLGISNECCREMFLSYSKSVRRRQIKLYSLQGWFLKLELFWELLNEVISEWDFFKILDYLAKLSSISLIFGTFAFVLESPERAEQRQVELEQKTIENIRNQYEAWQILTNPDLKDQASNGGRKQALENLNDQGIDLSGITMNKAILNDIFLKNARLRESHFDEARLGSANLQASFLSEASLKSANLFKANLSFADIIESHLESADLSYADLRDTEFIKVKLNGVRFDYANLRNATWIESNITGATFKESNLIGANLVEIGKIPNNPPDQFQTIRYNEETQFPKNFDRSKIQCCYIASDSKLIGDNLQRTDLSSLNIQTIHLENVDLRFSNLSDTNLSQAVIINTNFEHSLYNNQTLFPEGFNPRERGMYKIEPRANLEKANLLGRNLSGANLAKANLRNANLEGSDFSEANLQGADLRGSNLNQVNFRNANLKNARLNDDTLLYTNLSLEQQESINFN